MQRCRIPSKLTQKIVLTIESIISLGFVLDTALYIKMGLHLDDPVVSNAFRVKFSNLGFKVDAWSISSIGLIFIALLGIHYWLRNKSLFSSKPLPKSSMDLREALAIAILSAMGCCILFIPSINSTVKRMTPLEAIPFQSAAYSITEGFPHPRANHLKSETLSYQWKMGRKPDIVFIFSDGLRYDVLESDAAATLRALSHDKSCVSPERHYAGSHMTHVGVFAALFGMDPYYYSSFVESHVRPLPLRILKDNGYERAIFDSSGIASYVPPIVEKSDFDLYRDYSDSDDRATSDEQAVTDFLRELNRKDRDKPLFSFLFLYSTHDPYYSKESQNRLLSHDSTSGPSAKFRYLQSVKHVDQLVHKLTDSLESRIQEGKLILAISGDHGEGFGEAGVGGHATLHPSDTLIRVPMILCGVPGARKNTKLATHADLWPSIFELLADKDKSASTPKSPTWLSGHPVFANEERNLAIVSAGWFPTASREILVISGQRKYKLELSAPNVKELRLVSVFDSEGNPLPLNENEAKTYRQIEPHFQTEFGKYFDSEDRR
ncbi:MAG: sulfatase-like hydrolase/transferase [Bdellovibrionia bacterium]